jgi:hypothetical protein
VAPEDETPQAKPTPNQWRWIRDGALFGVGLLGVIHETYWTDFDRPGLLVLFAAMMGLPAFLRNGYDKK